MKNLGRNEDKHFSCEYEGHEDDCSKECKNCAFSIKKNGDDALTHNELEFAIKQYKRALFLEPRYAEAWANMGTAFVMRSEYNNAIAAFDKAISIDHAYGEALFRKAMTLKKQGKADEAMALANQILELYDNARVKDFKTKLIDAGVEDRGIIIDTEKAKATLARKANEVMENNDLLNESGVAEIISEIYQPSVFVESVFEYCKKKYASLGTDKVQGECIITSFYGSICAVLFYKRDANVADEMNIFEYLKNHIDVEFTDRNAERLLGTKAGEEKAETIWNLISPYVSISHAVFKSIETLTDDIILEAMKHAYIIGMLVAEYYTSDERKKHSIGTRETIDQELDNLAQEEQKQKVPQSAMCYSPRSI